MQYCSIVYFECEARRPPINVEPVQRGKENIILLFCHLRKMEIILKFLQQLFKYNLNKTSYYFK